MKQFILLVIIASFVLFESCKKDENPVNSDLKAGKWEIISNAGQMLSSKIFFADSKNGWIIGDSGKVSATNNGGLTWTKQESGTKGRLYSIYFIDSKNGFIGGNDRFLIRTSDGGLTWQKTAFNIDTSNFVRFIKKTDGKLWLGSGMKVYNSTDNGKTWEVKYNLSDWSADNIFIFGSIAFTGRWISNSIGRTTDNGQSWKQIRLPFLFLNNIYFLNDNTGWATEDNTPSSLHNDSSSVYHTSDGGDSWRKIITVQGFQTGNIYFSDSNNGWFSSWAVRTGGRTIPSRIYNTTDGGKTFSIQYNYDESDPIVDICFLDNNNAWALTYYGKVIRFNR